MEYRLYSYNLDVNDFCYFQMGSFTSVYAPCFYSYCQKHSFIIVPLYDQSYPFYRSINIFINCKIILIAIQITFNTYLYTPKIDRRDGVVFLSKLTFIILLRKLNDRLYISQLCIDLTMNSSNNLEVLRLLIIRCQRLLKSLKG